MTLLMIKFKFNLRLHDDFYFQLISDNDDVTKKRQLNNKQIKITHVHVHIMILPDFNNKRL